MATQSVMTDVFGPDFPLGLILVVTPGTPVAITSLVDPNNYYAPNTPTSATNPRGYTYSFQQIMFQGVKKGTSHGLQNNTGNIYLMRLPQGSGSGNRDDYGAMVMTVTPGQTVFLASGALVNNVLNPYRYLIDADNASDGALVTGYVW